MKPTDPAVIEYISRLQHALELDAWEIYLRDDEPAAEEDSITNTIMHASRTSTWRFMPEFFSGEVGKNWRTWSAEDARLAIVHELVHLHVHHYHADVMQAIERMAPPPMVDTLDHTFERLYERAVDSIAHAIAPLYDLPTWPDEEPVDSEGAWIMDKGRSEEARDPNRAPGTGLGDPGDQSQNPDVNPGGSDADVEEPATSDDVEPASDGEADDDES